jgi:hypothetical protein
MTNQNLETLKIQSCKQSLTRNVKECTVTNILIHEVRVFKELQRWISPILKRHQTLFYNYKRTRLYNLG